MKISLLQPYIERGNKEKNVQSIQRLIDRAKGDLLVTAEYALTGSLVLEHNPIIENYVISQHQLYQQIKLPPGKKILINHLEKTEERIFNTCSLLPDGKRQIKLYPDVTEKKNAIIPGNECLLFHDWGMKYKILICMDMKYFRDIDLNDADFLVWMYHFTEHNYESKIHDAIQCSKEIRKKIVISSLVSDINNGFSSIVELGHIISISNHEGILEIQI